VQQSRVSIPEAHCQLRALPYTELQFAKLDNHRALRNGFPEVVLCEGKQTEHVVAIMQHLCGAGGPVLATRAKRRGRAQRARGAARGALQRPGTHAGYNEAPPLPKRPGRIWSSAPALRICRWPKRQPRRPPSWATWVERVYDVGVAGLHRLLAHLDMLTAPDVSVLIVVAGMEGALPSVVGGLVSIPVIAVPTSVGYGASFWRPGRLAGHVEQLRVRRDGRQYRQWLRRRFSPRAG